MKHEHLIELLKSEDRYFSKEEIESFEKENLQKGGSLFSNIVKYCGFAQRNIVLMGLLC